MLKFRLVFDTTVVCKVVKYEVALNYIRVGAVVYAVQARTVYQMEVLKSRSQLNDSEVLNT